MRELFFWGTAKIGFRKFNTSTTCSRIMMADITDMYGAGDDDAPEVTQQVKRVVTNTGGLVEFEVNGTRVRTVDPGYVAMLENRLIRTEQEISDLHNEISRIHNSMRSRRAETARLQRQLDGKIDRQ